MKACSREGQGRPRHAGHAPGSAPERPKLPSCQLRARTQGSVGAAGRSQHSGPRTEARHSREHAEGGAWHRGRPPACSGHHARTGSGARPPGTAARSPWSPFPLALVQEGGGEAWGRTTGAKALFCFTAEMTLAGENEKMPCALLQLEGRVTAEAGTVGLAGPTATKRRRERAGRGAHAQPQSHPSLCPAAHATQHPSNAHA